MANLVIDIGNTRTKIAVFNDRKFIKSLIADQLTATQLQSYIATENITKSIISSVDEEAAELEDILKRNTKYIRFSVGIKTGIDNRYKTPNTFGLDRLAALIGAKSVLPDKNVLVIDAGTCITYDFIDDTGVYYGGSISPGLNMRLKAMHTFTGRLPLVNLNAQFDEWSGEDTHTAMLSGVVKGATAELLAFIENYNSRYPGLQIVLTGGNADFFDTRLKSSIFAHVLKMPHLVLIGLNEVINLYND